VTLDGEARWNYQRDAAKKVVQNLTGVTGVTSNIKIKEQTRDTVEKHAIEGALARNWTVNDQDIQVKVAGNKVTLNGVVNSWFQKEEAERIAWNAPGIWSVDNLLAVEYALSLID
jgi:osmotically-inducible protein OsmY